MRKLFPEATFWFAAPVANSDGTWDGDNPEGAEAFPTESEALDYAREVVRTYGGPDFVVYECLPVKRIIPRTSAIVRPLPRTKETDHAPE